MNHMKSYLKIGLFFVGMIFLFVSTAHGSCSKFLGGVNYSFAIETLGPPDSPGRYFTVQVYTFGRDYPPKLFWLGRNRERILAEAPNSWRWIGVKDSLKSKHTLPTVILDAFRKEFGKFVSDTMGGIRVLKDTRAGIVFLASQFPEVYEAVINVMELSKAVPYLSVQQDPIISLATHNFKKMFSEPINGKVVSLEDFRNITEMRSVDFSRLNFIGGESDISYLVVPALLDIYFYGIARYAKKLYLVGKKQPPLPKRLLTYFQKVDWRPVYPDQALIDLKFAYLYYSYMPLARSLQWGDRYELLIRQLVLNPEGIDDFEREISRILKISNTTNLDSKIAEGELEKSKDLRLKINELIIDIESRYPASDLTASDLKKIISLASYRQIPFR